MVLQTEKLTKQYGMRKVVNEVNMTIEKGEIYGLIGKNGAGKTTLMRLVLGTAFPRSGKVILFDGMDQKEAAHKIGSLIESPALFPGVTAFENMKRFALLTGSAVDDAQIYELLSAVGLQDTGKKKVKQFSLGMKQRLGIAIAMLGEPELLVLDEPVNGLDPTGMKEIRDLILRLNREKGITFLISSHLLDELSRLATRYGVIRDGVLIEEISAEELSNRATDALCIKVDRQKEAVDLLLKTYRDVKISTDESGMLLLDSNFDAAGDINRLLNQNGITVSRLFLKESSVEEYFLERLGE